MDQADRPVHGLQQGRPLPMIPRPMPKCAGTAWV